MFPLGTTTVTCSATDKAGNIGDSSFTVTVEDTTAPAVTVPANMTKEATSAAGATAAFSASASDAVDGSVATTCEPVSGSTFALGTTTVICSATDEAGNTGSDSFTVLVQDTTAPGVTVPANEVAEATGPNGAKVVYGDVSASDIVDGPMNPSCSQASDTVFPLGTTTVTCTATDAAGNKGTSTFTVKVVDTTAPEVQAPANMVVGNTSATGASNVVYTGATADDLVSGEPAGHLHAGLRQHLPARHHHRHVHGDRCRRQHGHGDLHHRGAGPDQADRHRPGGHHRRGDRCHGATVTYMGVTASDDVDGPLTATCSKASGTVFPLGTTTVTCSATDKAGNKGDNTFTVTVEDTTAPNLTVSAAKTATATSASGAVVTYTAPTAKDIVDGAVAASCDKASGSTFALGSTTVVCTAKDAAGNIGTESFTVTVTAAWSNVLQPVNADGSSIFKLGSTVPVKFQLTGASAGISNLSGRLYLQRTGAGATGTVLEAISTSNATTGNLFRYDATSNQYVFNLGTKTLSAGTYQLRVDLGDGVLRTVNISLR